MFDKMKDVFKSKALTCTNCGKKIQEGERFVADMILPSEKAMLVGRLDVTVAKTANYIYCEKCR